MAVLPSPRPNEHRLLLQFPSDVPDDAVFVHGEAYEGRRHLTAMRANGEYLADSCVAVDFDAARWSPEAIFAWASGWCSWKPVSFEPAPAIARKSADFTVQKAETPEGPLYVSGIVYQSGKLDTHGEFMRGDSLKDLAHAFNVECQKVDADHDQAPKAAVPVESWTTDEEDGTTAWRLKTKINDPELKRRILLPADDDEALTAYSFDVLTRKARAPVAKDDEAPGIVLADLRNRSSEAITAAVKSLDLAVKGDDEGTMAVEMYDAIPQFVSLVRRGANRESFVVVAKSAGYVPAATPPSEWESAAARQFQAAKAGKTLSAATRSKLQDCVDKLDVSSAAHRAAAEALRDLLDTADTTKAASRPGDSEMTKEQIEAAIKQAVGPIQAELDGLKAQVAQKAAAATPPAVETSPAPALDEAALAAAVKAAVDPLAEQVKTLKAEVSRYLDTPAAPAGRGPEGTRVEAAKDGDEFSNDEMMGRWT